jgi:Fe2+ or Zn2+ uptake regulation protein
MEYEHIEEKNGCAEHSKSEYDEFGFVKRFLCPFCGSPQLRFSHVDDVGTQWFKCEKCGRYCTLTKTQERKRLEEALAKPKEPQPTMLSHLNMVEDPSLAGKPVVVEALVSSTSVAYLCPIKVEASGIDEEGFDITTYKQIRPEDPLNLQLISVNQAVKYRLLKRFLSLSKVTNIQEKSYRTVYRIRVRPPVFTLEKRGEKIVDELGFEYKAYDIYIAAEKPIIFKPSSLIKVEGIPLSNPKNQQTTILAYKVEFPEDVLSFDVEKLKLLKKKFQTMSAKARVDWILENFELYSKIIARRNLAFAGLLTYFTPTWIKLSGVEQRGWGNTLFCGDTTTAKTETMRCLIRLLKAGMLITAETASIVGLTGTATQVQGEGWFVDWGFLVLLDRKLLAVDGAHKLSLSNWAALAEAERYGVVSIAKAAKNMAYARTRQIKIANPVDRQADKYSTRSLGSFLYPCQALQTILDKTSIARLDLAVFSDQNDVKPEQINQTLQLMPEKELFYLSEALKWCWSGKAQVEFPIEAIERIHREATELFKTFFFDEIPLCSIDMKWKLARLSAALAFLTLSTEDFEVVTVTPEHVQVVADFIREEYSKAGLNILAQTERHEALTIEDVESLLTKLGATLSNAVNTETLYEILRFFVIRGRVTRDELKAKFGLAENNQLRPLLAMLTSEGLIKVSRGFYPEPKLIQAYKVSEGFNFNKFNKLNKAGKEPQEKSEQTTKNDPSFSDLVNLVKLVKNGAQNHE